MIKHCLSKEEMSETLSRAIHRNILNNEDDTAILFYDLEFLSERIADLKNIFPSNTLHAIAVKANPLVRVLSKIANIGVGMEVASLPELYLAEKSGLPPDKIVFDSPSKTKKELEYALDLGVRINADSFDELERIDELLNNMNSESTIGIRLNPQIGTGSIKYLSVSDHVSKFGIPMNDHPDQIKTCFLKYAWLKGIHVHVGSQGCPVPLLIQGIQKVWDFAREINQLLQTNLISRRIEYFDIGGGLPVSYYSDIHPLSMDEYRNTLKSSLPDLFSSDIKIITEFGRYIHANTGWVAAKVEYVKREKTHNIIMTHVGADLLLRKCYNPDDWHHEITLVDKTGKLKTGLDKNKYIIAGPLCFAGDVIARDLELPVAEEGDYIMIHNTGAYTLSMWSRYNSRQIPKVIGYYGQHGDFEILRKREVKEDLFEFWS